MCNKLHTLFWKIPRRGVGYKLFELPKDMCGFIPDIRKMVNFFRGTPVQVGHKIIWNDKKIPISASPVTNLEDYGFTFFPTYTGLMAYYKRDIENELGMSYDKRKSVIITKITYYKGLGSHIEHNIDGRPRTIALCREYRIIAYKQPFFEASWRKVVNS